MPKTDSGDEESTALKAAIAGIAYAGLLWFWLLNPESDPRQNLPDERSEMVVAALLLLLPVYFTFRYLIRSERGASLAFYAACAVWLYMVISGYTN